MARVVTGAARRRGSELLVRVGPADAAPEPDRAEVRIAARSAVLSRRLGSAVKAALHAQAAIEAPSPPVVRVPSRRALSRLGAEVVGAIAVVPVRARNLRFAAEIVDGLREAGAAGVQLWWDGEDPPQERAEGRIFAILERARSTPSKAPVVLSRSAAPAESLRILIGARRTR
jgi:hypothetical protein